MFAIFNRNYKKQPVHIILCEIEVLILPFSSYFLYSSATVLLHTSLGTNVRKGFLWHNQGAIKSYQIIYQYKAAKHQKTSLFVFCVSSVSDQ